MKCLFCRYGWLALQYGWSPFIELSIQYNLVERTAERELLPMAKALGIGVTAWSPLAHGLLSGKDALKRQATGGPFPGLSVRNRAILQEVEQIADETGHTLSQVALAWMHAQAPVIIPIIAANTEAQIMENIASLAITLSPEQLRQLDEVSRIPLDFPLEFLAKGNKVIYAGMFDVIDSDRRERLQKIHKQVKQVPPSQKHYSPHTGEKILSQAPFPIATQQQSKQKRSWLDRLLNR